eukprot:763866-Hanusia_phi.AAC.4
MEKEECKTRRGGGGGGGGGEGGKKEEDVTWLAGDGHGAQEDQHGGVELLEWGTAMKRTHS